MQTRQLLDRVMSYQIVPSTAVNNVDISFIEVVDGGRGGADIPLRVVEVRVKGGGGTRYAARRLPAPHTDGVYIRNGNHPDYNKLQEAE